MESCTKKTTDDELLDAISQNTLKLKGRMWLNNIKYNEEHFGFNDTLKNDVMGIKKTLVMAAGPGFKRFMSHGMEQVIEKKKDLIIVACDGSLPILSQFDCTPDYVVSVDADPIITKFYKNSKNILKGTTAVLATSTDPSVVEECVDVGTKIKWIQPFFNNSEDGEFYRKGITSIKMGGNVGTTSYLLAAFALKSKPIGIMGIEFAWSDDTPYSGTQYYNNLLQSLDNNPEKVAKHYVRRENTRDGKTYIADPVYYAYFLMFKEIWSELPNEIKNYSYNLTREGILDLKDLKHINIEKFLDDT